MKVTGPRASTAVKHMSMGRAAWEMAYVMPDNKTVYETTDSSSGGFYKYVATTAGDLSAGVLSCALFNQTTPVNSPNGGAFTLSWIPMTSGPLTDATVLNWANGTQNGGQSQITFDDIFVIDLPTSATSGLCNPGFTSINLAYSYTVNGTKYYNECLKLNSANPSAAGQAAMFETQRYAAMLGCTLEFNKWEGITYSVKRKQLYTAMSYWTGGGMLPTTNTSSGVANNLDIGGSQDISVAAQPCGCVYFLNVDAATYTATDMAALTCGTPLATPDSNGNTCSPSGIASPDNVAVMEDFDTLIIGEDTGSHRVDYLWQYAFPNVSGSGSPANGTLTSIFNTVLGAETTSPFWHNMGNGMGYLSAVMQHPYGESDNVWGSTPYTYGVAASMGYIGPIPIPAGINCPPPPTPPRPPPPSPPPRPPPPSPPPFSTTAAPVYLAASLSGYTVATFTAPHQTAFVSGVALALNVDLTAVTITSVTAAASAGRHLSQSGVTVAFTVLTTSAPTTISTLLASALPAALTTSFAAAALPVPAVSGIGAVAPPTPDLKPLTTAPLTSAAPVRGVFVAVTMALIVLLALI